MGRFLEGLSILVECILSSLWWLVGAGITVFLAYGALGLLDRALQGIARSGY